MILLISEADMLIESRGFREDNHKGLVTVFLQKLESHDGILFLTANPVVDFDEAGLSRIHLRLKYAMLTHDARRIFGEIKNSIVVAQAMASAEDMQVTFKHLAKSTKFNNEFVEEFNISGRGPRTGE
ncbi:hypothetical protein BDW66DRAFT_146966 [Aspergillus desertorum]